MKRILLIAIACVCLVTVLAGCTRNKDDQNGGTNESVTPTGDASMDENNDITEPSSTVMPELVPEDGGNSGGNSGGNGGGNSGGNNGGNSNSGNNDTAMDEAQGSQQPQATDGADNATAKDDAADTKTMN